MDFLNIGKIRGALLSALIVCLYYYFWLPYLHVSWFGFKPEKGWGTILVFTGLWMTQIVVLQPGDKAKLTFFSALLDRVWNNGLAFLPNIFHTTIVTFRFAVLWGASRT